MQNTNENIPKEQFDRICENYNNTIFNLNEKLKNSNKEIEYLKAIIKILAVNCDIDIKFTED